MEKALTIKKVNAAFAALGIPERLARARGYFFFYGGAAPTWPKSTVFVERLNKTAPDDGNGGDYYVDTKNRIPLI